MVFNGRLAEIVGQYLRKGLAGVRGRQPAHRKWTNQSGVEKYSTEIAPTRCRCSVAAKVWAAKVAANKGGYDDGGYGDQGGGGYEPQAPRRAAPPRPMAARTSAQRQRPAQPPARVGF